MGWVSKYVKLLYIPQGEGGDSEYLKVPKREIFDRSDFPDFYTIKSLRVGDLRVKIRKNF